MSRDDAKTKHANAQKKYRKSQVEKDAAFKIRENVRIEKRRKERVASLNASRLAKYRKDAAERKKKSREKKKIESQNANLSSVGSSSVSRPYKKPQSLGKACNELFIVPYKCIIISVKGSEDPGTGILTLGGVRVGTFHWYIKDRWRVGKGPIFRRSPASKIVSACIHYIP